MTVALAVGLALGEFVVRVSGRAPDVIPIGVTSADNVYRRSTNPILSFEYKPGYRTDDPSVPAHYRRMNFHGFRDVEREYAKPAGTKRIILLGDSVVVGYGCPDTDKLMSRQLETLFDGENVEVLNLAVTGYCTRAEVEMLRTKGLAYDPDLVILVFVENDFRNFNPESGRIDGIADRPALANSLFLSSQMFRLACLELNWFGFGLEADPASWNQKAIGDNNVVDGLKLLHELAGEHGFEAAVAVWPGFTNDAIDYLPKMFLPGSRDLIVEELAHSLGLRVIGLGEPFRRHWQGISPPPNPRLYYTIGDQMHPSPTGHRVAAEILHRVIDEERLLHATPAEVPSQAADDAAIAKSAIEAARSLGLQKADYGILHFNTAIALRLEGKLDDAVEALRGVADSDSLKALDAALLMTSIWTEQGKLDQAEARLETILQAHPDHAEAHFALADVFRRQEKVDEAVEHLKRTVELRPEAFQAHFNLGFLSGVQGDWKLALVHMQKAVQLRPDDIQANRALADVLTQLGRKQEAAAHARRAEELERQTPANRR